MNLPVRLRRLEQLMHILPSASNLLRMSSSAKTQQYATHLRSIADSTLGGSVGSTARSLSLGLSAPGRRFEMSQSCTDKAPQNDKPESPAFCLFGQLHDYLTPWNQKPNKLSSPTTEPVHFCTSQASGRLSGSMDEILPPCLATPSRLQSWQRLWDDSDKCKTRPWLVRLSPL